MLNAKQCDAFYAVAKTGSFDLAAEQLNITASAVTLRVQSLEKKIGTIASGQRSALPRDPIRANFIALFTASTFARTEFDARFGWTAAT